MPLSDDDLDVPKSSFTIFGRDVMRIPCFRNTFLYSISSYVGVGLLTFLFTSKPRIASHVGFASFVVVTFGYYTKCRIDFANQKFQYGQLQKALQNVAVLEGSELAEEIREKKKAELVDA